MCRRCLFMFPSADHGLIHQMSLSSWIYRFRLLPSQYRFSISVAFNTYDKQSTKFLRGLLSEPSTWFSQFWQAFLSGRLHHVEIVVLGPNFLIPFSAGCWSEVGTHMRRKTSSATSERVQVKFVYGWWAGHQHKYLLEFGRTSWRGKRKNKTMSCGK